MTILFVTENLGSGGAERQLTGLAVLLARMRYRCTVVTWIDKNFYAEYLADNNVTHILLKPRNKLDRVLKMASLFRRTHPDAVISFLPVANETTALASLISSVKLIVSERSFTIDWGIRRKLTNLLYRRARYIVANSNNEAENIRSHCPRLASRTTAIPNYVDIEKFAMGSHREIKDNTSTAIVGVGRVIPSKNILNLLEALAIVRSKGFNFTFDWYGDTYDPVYFDEIQKKVNCLGLRDLFTLKGECKAIENVYRQVDAMCIPSTLEGYPNVLVEAMATGLPVAVSNVCEHPHIVEDGVNGFLFDPNNVEAIATTIIKVIRMTPEQKSAMAYANREKVINNNSAQTFVNRYIALL